MKVYHGSDVKIETIDLSKCRVGTDFGRGFYVTKFLKQAEDIAARVAFIANAFISCKQKRLNNPSNGRFACRTTYDR